MKKIFCEDKKTLMDLHMHTSYSDGIDEMEDMVIDSVNKQINVIGFTDHIEYLLDSGSLDQYIQETQLLRAKYETGIKILIGGEINCLKVLQLSNNQMESLKRLDYLLIEDIEYQSDLVEYFHKLSRIMPNITQKIGIAHLDLKRVLSGNGQNRLLELLNQLELHKMFIDISSHMDSTFFNEWITNKWVRDIFSEFELAYIVGSDMHDLSERNHARLIEVNSCIF